MGVILTWFVWLISSLIRRMSSSNWTWVRESAVALFTFVWGSTGDDVCVLWKRDWVSSSSWDSLSNIKRWALEVSSVAPCFLARTDILAFFVAGSGTAESEELEAGRVRLVPCWTFDADEVGSAGFKAPTTGSLDVHCPGAVISWLWASRDSG